MELEIRALLEQWRIQRDRLETIVDSIGGDVPVVMYVTLSAHIDELEKIIDY